MLIASLIGIVLLVVVDQLLKYWAITVLQPVETLPFLQIGDLEILDFRYLENDGAVFGSFSGWRWILVICTTVMIAVCLYFLIRQGNKSKLLTIGLSLVIAGGIGNLIDRLFRGGEVVDYIEIKLFQFAIFNFADCCVVIGVLLLLVYFFFVDSKAQKKIVADEAENPKVEEAKND